MTSIPTRISILALIATVVCTVPVPLHAQATTPPAVAGVAITDTSQAAAVKVYLDCHARGCDFDFMRDQIRWVNFVRDRLFADVVLLVTSIGTGGGGTQYTVAAIGGDKYRGRADTADVVTNPNDADDIIRRNLARTFSLLLAPYAARTPLAPLLNLTYSPITTSMATPTSTRDRWNFWVYRISANGFANGEKRSKFFNAFGSVSANRVTSALKINTSANVGYDESRFELGENNKFLNLQRNYGANALVVKSVTDHWSLGGSASVQYSDFFNYKLHSRLMGAVEYSVFPYKDFTRRQLTANYQLGVASYRYKEITLYERTEEVRPLQTATISWGARQPWGNVNLNLFGSQFLHDLSYYNYGVGGNVSLRIAKGLSFNVGGNYSRVNDQLYLRRGTLDDNQIIARQQALATNYRFFGNVGVSYTFGSIFNTVVNPRFGGSRGGEMMIF